jgi:hypothetical protein
MLNEIHKGSADIVPDQLKKIQKATVQNEKIFEYLMEASKHCCLG